jgi:drug/metabolite transporter (DMT)-like permease
LNRTQADLLVLAAAFIWGFAFYFQKTAMAHVGPLTFTGTRAVIAALVLLPFALRENRNATTPINALFPSALFGGLAFFVGGVLQQQGLITATVTNTSFLTALYVIFAPFLLWLINGERPGPRVLFATLLAFAGIWALGGGTIGGLSTGDLLVAASSAFWALYMVFTKMSSSALRPLGYTCASFITIGALSIPPAMMIEHPTPEMMLNAAPALLFVGVLSSALTFALLSLGVRHMPGTRASVLLSTEVLFAAAAGYLLLDERLTVVSWIGAGLMLCAFIVVQTTPAPQRVTAETRAQH